jgi:hypothetical protein
MGAAFVHGQIAFAFEQGAFLKNGPFVAARTASPHDWKHFGSFYQHAAKVGQSPEGLVTFGTKSKLGEYFRNLLGGFFQQNGRKYF